MGELGIVIFEHPTSKFLEGDGVTTVRELGVPECVNDGEPE